MKKLLAIPLMLIVLVGNSQNGFRLPSKEYAILNVFADYADTDTSDQDNYGLDFGMEFGYSGFVEAKLGFELFPELSGGYTEVHGAIGFRFVSGYDEQWNYYVGGRAGVVWREGSEGMAWRAIPGFESQIKYDIGDWFSAGLRYTLDRRFDMRILNWKTKNVNSVFIILTFKLKEL